MDKNPGICPSAARGPKGKLKSSFRTTNIGAWGKLSAKENTQKGVLAELSHVLRQVFTCMCLRWGISTGQKEVWGEIFPFLYRNCARQASCNKKL